MLGSVVVVRLLVTKPSLQVLIRMHHPAASPVDAPLVSHCSTREQAPESRSCCNVGCWSRHGGRTFDHPCHVAAGGPHRSETKRKRFEGALKNEKVKAGSHLCPPALLVPGVSSQEVVTPEA